MWDVARSRNRPKKTTPMIFTIIGVETDSVSLSVTSTNQTTVNLAILVVALPTEFANTARYW